MFELIEIQRTFDLEVQNKKYAKHLRKIFKKKYKQPKNDDEASDGNVLRYSTPVTVGVPTLLSCSRENVLF